MQDLQKQLDPLIWENKSLLLSCDTNLWLHTNILNCTSMLSCVQQWMSSTSCATLHTIMKQVVHFGCKCQMKTWFAFASIHYFWSLNISYAALITTKAFVWRLELSWVFFSTEFFCVLAKLVNSAIKLRMISYRIYVSLFFHNVWMCEVDCSIQCYSHSRGLVDLTFPLKLGVWTSALASCCIICSNSLKMPLFLCC